MKAIFTGLLVLLINTIARAEELPVNYDVLHYRFSLLLSDYSDTIAGNAQLTIQLLQPAQPIAIDLAGINAAGKGMAVQQVTIDGNPVGYAHSENRILLSENSKWMTAKPVVIGIVYKGIPADGLIIAQSKHQKRTFFGDNWPNRAHQWLPCHDTPSDKASVEFIVTAPLHYRVVANGNRLEEVVMPDSLRRTHWKETVALPTKVMVIGAADFAVGDAGEVNGIPLSSWVYAEEKEAGWHDYAQAKDILPFFINYIAPYSYAKLANVQSKTIFGGMENANTIFYFEESVTGRRTIEDLIAHEIAHQWFGNMVTEKAFTHLWLSEGFATYLTDMYLEHRYGTDSMQRRLAGERKAVIGFAQRSPRPVVDTTTDYMSLLNQNSYQKGAWILHMLRRQVGDPVFQKILQTYYTKFAGRNADSKDFELVVNTVSGKNFIPFFKQWLHGAGLPRLRINWRYNAARKVALVDITQVQESLFQFPLTIALQTKKGIIKKTILVNKRNTSARIVTGTLVTTLVPDPDTNLLWEWVTEPETGN
jgi:aminopeptidase N